MVLRTSPQPPDPSPAMGSSPKQEQPNILFIMSDDHAAKAISAYEAGINHTPNLDRIANEGVRFDHCYVTNSICTPSRAGILTGTYNHVNGVRTLDNKLDKWLPNVAKHLQYAGYQTAMIGKWHLGEGAAHEPMGFDHWSVLPGQGLYHDPTFIDPCPTGSSSTGTTVPGYITNIITSKSLSFLKHRDKSRPFFLMCHHKAPHRSWEPHPSTRKLYNNPIKIPETFTDDYRHRAKAAKVAKMRVAEDLTYFDLGLSQPEGGATEVGELVEGSQDRKVPFPETDEEVQSMKLFDSTTGERFVFDGREALREFKYQRYMQRYLRCVHSVDESVGELLDYLDDEGVTEDTLVMYTSDQGFFLGDHGWFDKRFIYEDSIQMPLLLRYPRLTSLHPGSISKAIVTNIDFALFWLNIAGLPIPSYMQGHSFLPLLSNKISTEDWNGTVQKVAYYRYWMHNDSPHEVRAHYGCRGERWKIVFWYNLSFGLPGTHPGNGEEEGEAGQEWELFDCVADPLELVNLYAREECQDVVREMRRLLEEKMGEVGDLPVHKPLSSSLASG